MTIAYPKNSHAVEMLSPTSRVTFNSLEIINNAGSSAISRVMPETSASQDSFDSTDLLALPVLPAVLGKLLQAFDDENVTIQRLARLIGYDATLSARMLAVANSATYRNRAPHAPTLESTLAALGPRTVRTIATTTALYQSCSQPWGIPGPVLEPFWRHSLTCAHIARQLAVITNYPEPEEAYLAGLLHDLGKLVIGARQATAFAAFHQVQTLTRTPGEGPELERRLFGADHCELGAALVETWQLNSFIADAIRFHHLNADELRGAHPLLCLLHVANVLARKGGLREVALASAEILFGLLPTVLRQVRIDAEWEVGNLAADLAVAMETREETSNADTEPALMAVAVARTPLGQTVHELALTNEARGEISGAGDEPAFLQAVARCGAILFDLAEVHLFLRDSKTGMLRARESEGLLGQIAIDPTGADNAVNRALRKRQISHSLGEGPPSAGIIDRQLARLWGTEGVLCLPLHAADQALGVLGIGIARAQLPRLLARTRLLRLFATAAATELSESRRREARQFRTREDRRLLEQQHLRAVLHEVSNPLTIMRNYLHLLAVKQDKQVAQEELKVLREETERVARILLRLSEPEGDTTQEAGFNLNKTIRDLARVLDDALCRPRGIRLNLKLADGLPLLARGRDAIRQIVLNLVRNAVEALEQGGNITVTTQDRINLQGRQYLEMAVADDGAGLPDDLRARLFQPTASMKGNGHAGLGLSIVRNLAEELDGYVGCRPNTGGGTVFLVLLPRP